MVAMGAWGAGCRAEGGAAAGNERPIEALVANDAETLDPRFSTDAVGVRVTRLVHAGLVRLDPTTLAPVPYVAKRWTWLDERTLRVELRDDVRFHSGAKVTARDVAATIEALQSPAVGSRHARVVDAIGGVDVESEGVVRIRMSRAHATLLTDLEVPILRADEAAGPPRPDGTLDGAGPFVVGKREPGAITLVPANAGAMPTPKHAVVVRTVHDENARALRMHAGRADLVVNGFSPTLLPSFEGAPGLAVRARPGANLTYVVVRTDRGALSDVRVRQAVALAIDRDEIRRTLLAGQAEVADTLLPPSHWAFSPAPPLPFDPDRARALLREARSLATNAPEVHMTGVRATGVRAPELASDRVSLTMLTSTDRLRTTIARVMAQSLREVGIDLDIVPLELGTMLGRLGAGDFDLATLQLPELTEPNVLRVFLHSSFVPPNGANRGRVRDPELDRLLDDGDRTTNEGERRAIYAALERRVRDEAWILPLWHEHPIAVVSPRAAAFLPSAEGRWLSLAELP